MKDWIDDVHEHDEKQAAKKQKTWKYSKSKGYKHILQSENTNMHKSSLFQWAQRQNSELSKNVLVYLSWYV